MSNSPYDNLSINDYQWIMQNLGNNLNQYQYMQNLMQQMAMQQQQQNVPQVNPSFQGGGADSTQAYQNTQFNVDSASASDNIQAGNSDSKKKSGGVFGKLLLAAAAIGTAVVCIKAHKKVKVKEAKTFWEGIKKSLPFVNKAAEKAETKAADIIPTDKLRAYKTNFNGKDIIYYRVPGKTQTLVASAGNMDARAAGLGIKIPAAGEVTNVNSKIYKASYKVDTKNTKNTVVTIARGLDGEFEVVNITKDGKNIMDKFKNTDKKYDNLRADVQQFIDNVNNSESRVLEKLTGVTKQYKKDNTVFTYKDNKLHSIKTDRFSADDKGMKAYFHDNEGAQDWVGKISKSKTRKLFSPKAQEGVYIASDGTKISIENGEVKGIYKDITIKGKGGAPDRVEEVFLGEKTQEYKAWAVNNEKILKQAKKSKNLTRITDVYVMD